MKAFVFSIKENPSKIINLLKKYHIEISRKNPDFIITYGGDGTFLVAEQRFPGIPKLLIRSNSICINCGNMTAEDAIRLVSGKSYHIEKIRKLEASSKNKKIKAVNDIVVRNKNQQEAIRFSLSINKKSYPYVIGDGIVAATMFGSTAYFMSITKRRFNARYGIAFNNTREKIKPIIISNSFAAEVRIIRGRACLTADNNHDKILVNENESIKIRPSRDYARIIKFRRF